MRPEIIERQRRIMADNGLDALVAISPENFAWTTGFVVPSQPILRWRHAMVVVKADGTHAVVGVDMEETTVRNRLPGEEVRVWGEFTDNAMTCLAALLVRHGAGGGAHRHRDGLCAGRRLRGPAATHCRRRRSARPSSFSRARARSRRRTRSRCCAGSRASPIHRSPMRSPRCRPAAPRWTSPPP